MSDQPKVETVENPIGEHGTGGIDSVVYSPQFEAMCSIGKDKFQALAEINMRVARTQKYLEFESFDKWLDWYVNLEPITIEESAIAIYNKIKEVMPDAKVQVIVRASTVRHFPALAMKGDF